MNTLQLQFELVLETCCRTDCGMTFAIPRTWQKKRIEDHSHWFCPNGHEQRYTGQTEEAKLRAQLEREQADKARVQANLDEERRVVRATERRLASTRGVVTRVKNRIKNGVCPCCRRSFENLAQHMKTKHQRYVKES